MNTDEFEGHTPAPWIIAWWDGQWYVDDEDNNTVCELDGTAQKQDPTAKLIAAAPDLLAEVKRLRSIAWDLYLFYTDMGYDGSLSMIEDRMDWVPDEAFYGGEKE